MLLKDIFKQKDRTFSFEVFPAKTPEGDIRLIHEILKEFSLLKPDFVSCTYGAGGGNRDKTLAIVEHIQKAYNREHTPSPSVPCMWKNSGHTNDWTAPDNGRMA